jgi:pimeloyl-ACP methyl ester carboxylesterase
VKPVCKAALVAALVFLAGCAAPGLPAGSREKVLQSATRVGFLPHEIETRAGPLFALLRPAAGSSQLTVFIEGDGAAWLNARWPPADPTPERSIPLALALKQPGLVAYLARPCQFARDLAACAPRWWTADRFSAAAVEAMSQALDQLKREAAATELVLIGYSGGGTIAALLAQRRSDVVRLVTLAAPLALSEWTRRLDVAPLPAALDPLAGPPLRLPARHFAGGRDRIVPAAVVERFASAQGGQFILKADFDHGCCWDGLTPDELMGE